jgi:triacylglycerol esterase/lipase EstA (alpha/beta hydrolase family)
MSLRSLRHAVGRSVTAVVAGTLLCALVTGPAAATTAPPPDAQDSIAAAQAEQSTGLVGANDWSCKPSAAHPDPVVLVHGTFVVGAVNWVPIAALLTSRGYCVFSLDYGWTDVPLIPGLAPIPQSAAQLETFVDGVLAATGAKKVDIVGHSQGGLMPRYYLKFLGGAAKTNAFVALAPTSHGTTLSGIATLLEAIPGAPQAVLGSWCPACLDQATGSPFLTNLNAGGDTVPGVDYTVLSSIYDFVATPVQSQFLSGPDVHNILLQDDCVLDTALHTTIQIDPVAEHEILNALDPAHASYTGCRLFP